MLTGHRFASSGDLVDGGGECGGSALTGARRPGAGEADQAGGDREPRLDDAACDVGVELAVAHEQPGEQVQAGVPLEVPHGGGAAVADLDQPGRRHPLQRFAYGGPGDAEQLGQLALARQRVARAERAVDDLAEELLEDVVRYQAPGDGFEDHGEIVDPGPTTGQVV